MTGTRGNMLNREAILSGRIDRYVGEYARRYGLRINSVEERTEIKRSMLATVPHGEDVWVFGYGSLIWNPAFHHVEARCGRVYGYHRRFVFWSKMGRGSPDRPGLMLGLARGGSCNGLAFRVAAAAAETELQSVFMREMVSTAYHARWLKVETGGGPVRAIGFVANPEHRFYAGRVPLPEAARYIAVAEGRLGTSRDYLHNTVSHLEALGIEDAGMRTLRDLVMQYRANGGADE